MRLEAHFAHDIGDFVCMCVDAECDRPDKLQVIACFVSKDFAETKIAYHVRSHTAFHSGILQVAEEEILPYPNEQALQARAENREQVRAEMDARRQEYRKQRQAKNSSSEAQP